MFERPDEFALLPPQPLHGRLLDLLEGLRPVARGTRAGEAHAASGAVEREEPVEALARRNHALSARFGRADRARGTDLRGSVRAGSRRVAAGPVALGRARAQGARVAG